MSDSGTPRSSRGGKKKSSALSKLAAKRTPRQSDDSDVGSRASLVESGSRDDLARSLHRQRLSANPTYSSRDRNISPDSDDSDEGIDIGSGNHSTKPYRTSSDALSYSKFGLPKVENGQKDPNSDPESGPSKHYGSYGFIDIKGDKRGREPNSDGDEIAREMGRVRGRKHVAVDDEDENSDGGRSPSPDIRHGRSSSDSHQRMDWDTSGTSTLRNPPSSIDHKKKITGTQDDSLTERYRRVLEGQRSQSDMDLDEARAIPAFKQNKFGPPRPSSTNPHYSSALQHDPPTATMPSYSSGMYPGIPDPPWSSNRSGPAFDAVSQRSFQSTSVLPMISTKEAKNRSFLVGSITSSGSLMSAEELERYFPDRKMRVYIGTWNMMEMKTVPSSLDEFVLPDTSEYVHDLYVIGSQESVSNRREWEVKLQETLGPQHVLLHSAAHGALYLSVFLRRDLVWFCSVCEDANISTRPGPSGIKTKGAVAICFTFFGTSFLFINSHFSPHDGHIKDRIADYQKIAAGLNLPKVCVPNTPSSSSGDVTSRFDCVFWMGDLNFRIEKERERVDVKVKGLSTQETPNYEDLLEHDELTRARNEELAFQEFQEGRIKFKPTYKYDLGTDEFDSSKKMRIPSYTDRILFRVRKKHSVTCLHYDSAHEVRLSDHKPVYSMFEVLVRPGRDNIPLAAGQFNREVWLEGNRRRSAKLDIKQTEKSSSVCTVQ